MVQNYVLSDSVARRCLGMCQVHTSKERCCVLGRCTSTIKAGFIFSADLIKVGVAASLACWRLRSGTFSWTFQQ